MPDLAVETVFLLTELHKRAFRCTKLGQMQPGISNLLVIHVREDLAHSLDLGKLMQGIKTRVEGRDPAFYELSRYESPAAFYKEFLHLSGILLWTADGQLWVNKQARPPLTTDVLRLVSALPQNHRAGTPGGHS